MIDPTDLMQFKASEMKVGGVFYVKDGDEFRTAKIDEKDLKSDRIHDIRARTHQLSIEGKLYRRINKPWCAFDI